jgi:hypothetical protein
MNWRETYKLSLMQLSTPSLYGEILRLENSIKHLRRSNEELRIHENNQDEDTSWVPTVIAENEEVISKQNEQVELIKGELSERGTRSEHADDHGEVIMNGNGKHVADGGEDEADGMEIDESDDGVHL